MSQYTITTTESQDKALTEMAKQIGVVDVQAFVEKRIFDEVEGVIIGLYEQLKKEELEAEQEKTFDEKVAELETNEKL